MQLLTLAREEVEEVEGKRERERGREGERERSIHVRNTDRLPYICMWTNWGPKGQSRYATWLGMEPVNFWRTAQYSNQLSHLAEANVFETLKKKKSNRGQERRKNGTNKQTNSGDKPNTDSETKCGPKPYHINCYISVNRLTSYKQTFF